MNTVIVGNTTLTTKESVEKTARSIFVGNIPYEATEEKLIERFSKAGPVLSFRMVYDRESGKPKGYGFCEYENPAIAASALRNLQSIEYNGRPLRIGPAAGEQNSAEVALSNPNIGPPQESPFGDRVDPSSAPEAISRAVASLPPEQMYELMKQMQLCIQNNPNEARNMLLQNPQLAYALLQAQIVMKIVDPKVAIAMLNRSHDQIPPVKPAKKAEPRPMMPQFREEYPMRPMAAAAPAMLPGQPIRGPMPPFPPGGPGMPLRRPPPPPMSQPHPSARPPTASAAAVAIGEGDEEKKALISQVLKLSDEQISRLPEDQKRSIRILKEQLSKSGVI